MIAKLTQEQIAAINAVPPHENVELIDEDSQKSYILFDKAAYEAWVDQKLQEAFDDIDAGRVEPWDIERIKSDARARATQRQNTGS